MAHYLIFIPHKRGSNPGHLAEVGLGDLLRPGDSGPDFSDLEGAGPGSLPGQIVTWRDPEHRDCNPALGYLPDRQKWQPARPDPERELPAARFWYGIETARPPRPIDLERSQLLEGFDTELGDGRLWTMPNCLRLPHRFDLGDDGRPCRKVKESFSDVFDRALWAFAALEQQIRGKRELLWEEGFEYCARMLGLNYRVERNIAAWLGLFDDENYPRVMAQTVDKVRLSELLDDVKKNGRESSPATPAT